MERSALLSYTPYKQPSEQSHCKYKDQTLRLPPSVTSSPCKKIGKILLKRIRKIESDIEQPKCELFGL